MLRTRRAQKPSCLLGLILGNSSKKIHRLRERKSTRHSPVPSPSFFNTGTSLLLFDFHLKQGFSRHLTDWRDCKSRSSDYSSIESQEEKPSRRHHSPETNKRESRGGGEQEIPGRVPPPPFLVQFSRPHIGEGRMLRESIFLASLLYIYSLDLVQSTR